MRKIKRLMKSLAWKVFPWTNFNFKMASGVRLCLQNRADFPILQEIFIERSYEPFLKLLPEIKTWVDLGCNCGLFSLYLEDRARTEGWKGLRQAVLIDANSYALKTVARSLAANKLEENFQLINGLVGKRNQTMSYFESKSTYKSSIFQLASKEKSRQIKSVDLEEQTRLLNSIDLIKVDIEGAEIFLAEDWMAWLKSSRYVLVEWHEPHMTGRRLEQMFTEAGFTLILSLPPAYLASDPRAVLDLPIGSGLWKTNSSD